MQEGGVLSDDRSNWIFEHYCIIFLDDDGLTIEITPILLFGQHDAVVVQFHRLLPFMPVVMRIILVEIEVVFMVISFAILLLKLVISYFIADIADHTGGIPVFLTQKTVLLDACHVDFID